MSEGQAANANFTNKKVLDECPRELIIEAAKSYAEVMVNIRRRQPTYQYGSCGPHRLFQTLDLLSIDDFIRDNFGGGRFQIDTYYPQDRSVIPVPSWHAFLEGPPKAGGVKSTTLPGTLAANGFPAPQGLMPPGAPAAFFMHSGQEGSMPSDQVAMDALQHTRQELMEARTLREKERAEAAERERKRDEEMLALRKEMLEERRREAEERAKADVARLERLITEMRAAPPPAPKRDILDYVPMVTALVPVFTAFISASRDQAARMAEAQTASMTATVNALAKPDNSKPGQSPWALLIPALPAVMPFFMKLMEERSPSKIAELVGTMGESNMTMLSLVGQLVQQAMGSQPDNPWMPVIQQAIENMTSVAQTMATTAGGKPAHAAAAPRAPQTQVVPSAEQQQRELQMMRQMTPEQLTKLVQEQPNVPKDYLTPQWTVIFLDLHRGTDAKVVAENLANLLQSLEDQHTLPVLFTGLFDEGTNAAEILWRFMSQLPVAVLNNAYAQDVCRICGGFFVEAESEHVAEVVEDEGDDDGDDGDDDQKTVVTPAPAKETQQAKGSNGVHKSQQPAMAIPTPGGSVFSR